jgi:ATP-dependent Lon protease
VIRQLEKNFSEIWQKVAKKIAKQKKPKFIYQSQFESSKYLQQSRF